MESGPLTLLLDLSGNKQAALKWAAAISPGAKVEQLNKANLKRASKREALARVRAMRPAHFLIFTSDVSAQSGRGAFVLFAILAGARRVIIGDGKGGALSRSWLGALLLEAPRLALEVLAGYLLIIPLSWLLTEALRVSLVFRNVVRASRVPRSIDPDRARSFKMLYVRATLSSAAEGGMPTHVAGLAGGSARLGHQIKFLVSGAPRDNEDTVSVQPSAPSLPSLPSLLFGATRTLFELWNNLLFTTRSLHLVASATASGEFDFIYQRYSRFNWTGAVLSVVTGLPLLLEFNGSEVWISRQWDPIGQLWLLERFERVNQRAADLIFVVSEVERRNLIDAGVDAAKIIVNPNGVDTERFHPDRGGAEVRRALGIEHNIVVGFVGTFGPWHGAPVLAKAAAEVDSHVRCHFLFVGDGDERAQTESIVEASGASATFTGSVAHDKVPAYLDSCDLLVSPHVLPVDGSEFFGSPTKLFEYMAMAKPIVASRLGQIAEVIVHGENGLLVEPGDAVALARAIEKLAQDEGLRTRLGSSARSKVVEFYTWKHNAARVFDSFEHLSRKRARTSGEEVVR